MKSTKILRTLITAAALVCGFPAGQALAESQETSEGIRSADQLSSAFQYVAQQITPSVVSVSSVKRAKNLGRSKRGQPNDQLMEQFRQFFGDDFMDQPPFRGPDGGGGFAQQGLGTGVIVDTEGHILTNNHVIGEADEVTVRLSNEQQYKAKVVGTDPRSDVAVIQIKAPNLVPANLGDSDSLRIGQWVVAAGSPFGLSNSITAGIVSAKGRSIMGGGQFEDFIQTDAAINPGNSGGPLVNLHGDVVGINTAIFTRSGGYMGIGFAIPINMAKTVMQSLITKGKVVRGWLGVVIQDLTEDLAKSFNVPETEGALVGNVEKDSPGDKGGLKQGDIITAVDGEKIKNINQLRNLIAGFEPGRKVKIDYIRDGRKASAEVKIGELPASANLEPGRPAEDQGPDLGMSIEDVSPEQARRLGIKGHGVVVRSVSPGSLAAEAGIAPLDLIKSVNGKEAQTTSEFYKLVKAADIKKGLRLVVETNGMQRFVYLKEEAEE